MKFATIAFAGAALAALGTSPALAGQTHADRAHWKADKVQVVETDSRGRASKVKIADQVYDVCMNDNQTDGCINPRAAGLNWGDRPLGYWPGNSARGG